MRKFNTQRILKDRHGKDVLQDEKPALLGDIVCEMLFMHRRDQTKSYLLAKKFANETERQAEVELKSEDVVFVKRCIEEAGLPSITVGQIVEELEGELV